MCVIPGVILTLKDETGFDFNSFAACMFPDKNLKTLDPKAQTNTTIQNISDIFKKHEDKSITTSSIQQNIVITEGANPDDMDNPFFQSKQPCQRPGLAGYLGMTIDKPMFGCSPDLTQKIDMEMSEIKESLVDDFQEITQAIVSDLSLKATGGKPDDGTRTDAENEANKFIQDQLDNTEEYVKDLLEKLRIKYSQKDQNAILKDYRLPFSCDCEGRGPTISQETKFKMFSQEIYEAVRKRIIDKSIEAGMDIELEGESSEPGAGRQILCFFQILACTASVLAVFWLVYSIATNKNIIEEDKANAARPGIVGKVVQSKIKMKEKIESDKLEAGKEKRQDARDEMKAQRQENREVRAENRQEEREVRAEKRQGERDASKAGDGNVEGPVKNPQDQ